MNFKNLKKLAHACTRESLVFPSDSLWLCEQLGVSLKDEKQCQRDHCGKVSPLYDTPAFLYTNKEGNKMIYYNSTARYWNFYLFHEIAHYLLVHEENTPDNEREANLLACMLVAPIEKFPTTIRTATDLSTTANIPIDKAEEYWQKIRDEYLNNIKKKSFIDKIFENPNNFLIWIIILFILCGMIIILSIICGILMYKLF